MCPLLATTTNPTRVMRQHTPHAHTPADTLIRAVPVLSAVSAPAHSAPLPTPSTPLLALQAHAVFLDTAQHTHTSAFIRTNMRMTQEKNCYLSIVLSLLLFATQRFFPFHHRLFPSISPLNTVFSTCIVNCSRITLQACNDETNEPRCLHSALLRPPALTCIRSARLPAPLHFPCHHTRRPPLHHSRPASASFASSQSLAANTSADTHTRTTSITAVHAPLDSFHQIPCNKYTIIRKI
jgi:hypothetical protein